MNFEPYFYLPFDEFASHFDPYALPQKVVVVSAIGKLDLTQGKPYVNVMDNMFASDHHAALEPRYQNNTFHIEGRYVYDEKVLYLTLYGPWNSHHLKSTLERLEQDATEMGFLQTWNMYTNLSARALLFIFTMSHIVVVYSPSHSPDVAMIQLLRLLSYVWPKYQILQTNLLSRTMDVKDSWHFHGRFCSPRLLFVFTCPPDTRNEPDREEMLLRIQKQERALEDRIYMTLRKSRTVKFVCNRAFYSIAPNDEFVYVENPPRDDADIMERLVRSFQTDCTTIGEESGSEDDGACSNFFRAEERGHTFRQFLQKHITKAHSEGFYDNMGKYNHVKPFFQRPTLQMWFEAANTILHDPDIGLGNDLSVFPTNKDSDSSPDLRLLGGSMASSGSLAAAIYQGNRSPQYNRQTRVRPTESFESLSTEEQSVTAYFSTPLRRSSSCPPTFSYHTLKSLVGSTLGAAPKPSRQDRRDERRRLQLNRRRAKKGSPDRERNGLINGVCNGKK